MLRMLALDVDGVLTDGVIHLDAEGHEHKRLHVTDGLGIRLLLEAGLRVGLISARRSVAKRAKELSLPFAHMAVRGEKWQCLQGELLLKG
ncbi:MAG TPA: HAD family hydrolase, partial [Magnetococcales bacterium]|nr:HAD family hydrolase [Magnetococcales bacterium]